MTARHIACAIACAVALPASGEPRGESVVIDGVPHVKQRPDFCGEACVAMYAHKLGVAIDQDDVFAATGLDPALGRGAYTQDLVRAVKALGFAPPHVYTLVDARAPAAGIARELDALRKDLARGVPSILCMHYDAQPHTTEHFRLVVGYDAERDEIVYNEPAEDDGGYRRMTRARLAQLWPLPSSDASKRVLVRIPLVAAHVAAPARAADGASPADLVQHVMALNERLADWGRGGMGIRVTAPFVVIGVQNNAAALRWARDHLPRDHGAVVDVFVFRDRLGYEHGVQRLTGEPPPARDGFVAGDVMYVNVSALDSRRAN